MSTAVQDGRALASVAGDQCTLDGERLVVRASCGLPTLAHACLSCRTRLANQYQIEAHTERGAHVICRLCPFHGAEEWQPDDSPTPTEATVATTTKSRRGAAPKQGPPLAIPQQVEVLARIPVSSVDPSPYQPRRTFDDAQLQELSASLQASGLLQPITVRQFGARYELIAGERRLRAAQLAGWAEIPAVVRPPMEDVEAATLALVENLQRADLSPLEEAQSFKQLMRARKLSQTALAELLGIPRSTVGDRLGLLEIGPWLELLSAGEITVSQAVELRKYRGAQLGEHQKAIAKARKEHGALQAVEVGAFRSNLRRWYRDSLYPLEQSPHFWEDQPKFDTSAHDAECQCGRPSLGLSGDGARDYCLNPEWWLSRDLAARATGPEAGAAAAATTVSGAAWSDLGVTLSLPEDAHTIDRDVWGLPEGHALLVGSDGRWESGARDEWDPADVMPLIADEELVAIRDLRRGGWLITTTATGVVEIGETIWRNRWAARESDLRAAVEVVEDHAVSGPGVRTLLLALADREDDLLCDALNAQPLLVPEDVRAEVADSYPAEAATAWLQREDLTVLAVIATGYLERVGGREGDSIDRQVRAEESAALEEIRRRPVPWVTARPPLLGEQEELLPDPADARAVVTCIRCGCTDTRACPEGCCWSAVEPAHYVGVCSSCAETLAAAKQMLAAHLAEVPA